MVLCPKCNKIINPDDLSHYCISCDNHFHFECMEMKECDTCNTFFCEDCMADNNICQTCDLHKK
jgi:hypothetical protein